MRLFNCAICFLFILSLSTCITVRMTDRKPRWALLKEQEEMKKAEEQEKLNKENSQESLTDSLISNGKAPEPEPAFNYDSISRRKVIDPFSGPECLSSLQNVCSDFNDNHYTYHVCPYRYIAQVENTNYGFQGCIGVWGDYFADSIQKNEVRLSFVEGDLCPGDLPRKTELIISCDPYQDIAFRVSSVQEVEMCSYVIEASSPQACNMQIDDFLAELDAKSSANQDKASKSSDQLLSSENNHSDNEDTPTMTVRTKSINYDNTQHNHERDYEHMDKDEIIAEIKRLHDQIEMLEELAVQLYLYFVNKHIN